MHLIIETTRRCNLCCPHCLRGPAQNRDIKLEYITQMLEYIHRFKIDFNVTFTGGEPSLNIKAIEHFNNECLRLNINPFGFYIATNGQGNNSKDFIFELLRLYSICDQYERDSISNVELSNDEFHHDMENSDNDLINCLSFYRKKYKEDYHFINDDHLIKEGNNSDNPYSRELLQQEINTLDDFNGIEIYLNVNGDIIAGCDWSYQSQENNKLCNIDGFEGFYKNLKEKELKEV